MASIMRTKLGSWLVVAPLDDDETLLSPESLPSPEQLKFKILIKSKVLPPDATTQEITTDTDTESERGLFFFCILCGHYCFVFWVKHMLIVLVPSNRKRK